MGLFKKAMVVKLKELKCDLVTLLKEIEKFQNSGRRISDRDLLNEFLKLNSLYKRIKSEGGEKLVVTLVQDFKLKGLRESDLRSFSVCFQRFIDTAQNFDNIKKFRDANQPKIGAKIIGTGSNFAMVLAQATGAAHNLIGQIDQIIKDYELSPKK